MSKEDHSPQSWLVEGLNVPPEDPLERFYGLPKQAWEFFKRYRSDTSSYRSSERAYMSFVKSTNGVLDFLEEHLTDVRRISRYMVVSEEAKQIKMDVFRWLGDALKILKADACDLHLIQTRMDDLFDTMAWQVQERAVINENRLERLKAKAKKGKAGRNKDPKSEDSLSILTKLLEDESNFDDMDRGTRQESWEWIGNKISYPNVTENTTPYYKSVRNYLHRNSPILYRKLQNIMAKK